MCPVKEAVANAAAPQAKKGRKALNEAHQIVAASNRDYKEKLAHIKKASGTVDALDRRGPAASPPSAPFNRPPTPIHQQHDVVPAQLGPPKPQGDWFVARDEHGQNHIVKIISALPSYDGPYDGPLKAAALPTLEAVNERKSRRNDKTVEKSRKMIHSVVNTLIGRDHPKPEALLRLAESGACAAQDEDLRDDSDVPMIDQLLDDLGHIELPAKDEHKAVVIKQERPSARDTRSNVLSVDGNGSGNGRRVPVYEYDVSDSDVQVLSVGSSSSVRPKNAGTHGAPAAHQNA